MIKPTKIYAERLEQTALDQFEECMSHDFSVQGALMPDAHTGYTAPIGCVIATKDVVVPSWVGYDIGCGMCALPIPDIDAELVRRNQKAIFNELYATIPVGFNINKFPTVYSLDGLTETGKEIADRKEYRKMLGSLGGGNHFIEVGTDETDTVWVIIHSGSRGVGYNIAQHYIRMAHPEGKAKEGTHALSVDSELGKAYIQDLNWTLDYALENRKQMMYRTVAAISHLTDIDIDIDMSAMINRNHNHAVEKDGLWIHRKGATHAEKGMTGVIPGNMRDGSFIVVGKGNPESLCSSSHGAGRVMGRKQAKRELDEDDFVEEMMGITAKVGKSTLDEAPMAYKDIYEVMALQSALVDMVAHVKPIINIKG